MNIKNIFKKQPKQQQQYVDIKYSKLDHIGKVQRIPIVQKEQLDNINNQIANFQNELTELTKKVNRVDISNPKVYTKELEVQGSGHLIDYRELDFNNKKYGLFAWKKDKSFALSVPQIAVPQPDNHTQNQLTIVYCYVSAIKFYNRANQLQRTVEVPLTYIGYVSWYPTTGNSFMYLALPYTNTDLNPDMKTVNWIFEFENYDKLINTTFENIKLTVEMYAEPYIYKGN